MDCVEKPAPRPQGTYARVNPRARRAIAYKLSECDATGPIRLENRESEKPRRKEQRPKFSSRRLKTVVARDGEGDWLYHRRVNQPW
jgi:hypothetical protein